MITDTDLLARRGNFILVRDREVDKKETFVVYESSPSDFEDGYANYGERFAGLGQGVYNLLTRYKRGY